VPSTAFVLALSAPIAHDTSLLPRAMGRARESQALEPSPRPRKRTRASPPDQGNLDAAPRSHDLPGAVNAVGTPPQLREHLATRISSRSAGEDSHADKVAGDSAGPQDSDNNNNHKTNSDRKNAMNDNATPVDSPDCAEEHIPSTARDTDAAGTDDDFERDETEVVEDEDIVEVDPRDDEGLDTDSLVKPEGTSEQKNNRRNGRISIRAAKIVVDRPNISDGVPDTPIEVPDDAPDAQPGNGPDAKQAFDRTMRLDPDTCATPDAKSLHVVAQDDAQLQRPRKVGERAFCRLAEGSLAEAVIVALTPEAPLDPERLYVHFLGLDRRLDRWVSVQDVHPAPSKQGSAPVETAGPIESGIDGMRTPTPVSTRARAALRSNAGQPKVTRSRRRALEEINPVSEKEVGNEMVARLEEAREEHTKVRNIATIVFGVYDIDVWYFSPYPGKHGHSDRLYICSFCLKYMRSCRVYEEHCESCEWVSPPGTVIYSDPENKVRVQEVDGLVNAPYCQRLCLLGKLFLDHKTLYFDVAPFLFYVVLLDNELAGFFSKEKPLVASEFNLACIVTLPQHQRKGLGRFLISLSYELTKREGKTGSPERPLSDLGQVSYRSYWMHSIMSYIRSKRGAVGISAKDVANATGIRVHDIVTTLKSMGILTIWKGETYVDTNAKALEQAHRRVRNPRLPLKGSLLDWATMKKPDPIAPLMSPKSPFTPAPPPAPAVGPRGGRIRKPRSRPSPSPVASPAMSGDLSTIFGSGTPTGNGAGNSGSGSGASGPFSDDELNAMKEFVLLHTAEKVHAPLNTEHGLQSVDVHRLAESLNMTMERCRKKLKRMSAAALADPAALMAGRDVPIILGAPSLSPSTSIREKPLLVQSGVASPGDEACGTRGPGYPPRDIRSFGNAITASATDDGLEGGVRGGNPSAHTSELLTDAVDGGLTPAASPDIDLDRSNRVLQQTENVDAPKHFPVLQLQQTTRNSASWPTDSPGDGNQSTAVLVRKTDRRGSESPSNLTSMGFEPLTVDLAKNEKASNAVSDPGGQNLL
jgi:histone acetyltransferase MYST1